VFTDGAGSQFKNRYVYHHLSHFRKIFGFAILGWNFFATAHGKGPVDGVGGTLKRMARSTVLRRKCNIHTAAELAAAVNGSGIRTIVVNDAKGVLIAHGLLDDLQHAPQVNIIIGLFFIYNYFLHFCTLSLSYLQRYMESNKTMRGGRWMDSWYVPRQQQDCPLRSQCLRPC
jgi:hypothetical protein